MFKRILSATMLSIITVLGCGGTVSAASSAVPVFRLYNPSIMQHLLTTDSNEYNYLQAQPAPNNWQADASSFMAFNPVSGSCSTGTEPIYRMYNNFLNDDHLYTSDWNEINYWTNLNPSSSWKYEGIAFCEYASNTTGTIPVYRIFSASGTEHLITADVNEFNTLVSKGWGSLEGIAFYAPTN